jgi:lysyl-tRNA synthetase class 1
VAPLAGFNEDLAKKMLAAAGFGDMHHSAERFAKVKYWLENFSADKIYRLLPDFNVKFYATLNAEQKEVLGKLRQFLENRRTEKEIQEFLYQIINIPALTKKENQLRQQEYFRIFYQMLFGREEGPRLYLFLAVSDKKTYLKLFAE